MTCALHYSIIGAVCVDVCSKFTRAENAACEVRAYHLALAAASAAGRPTRRQKLLIMIIALAEGCCVQTQILAFLNLLTVASC
jgi:hypothetical protein